MYYKSIKNLRDDIISNIYKVDNNINLIVGIPRSGMLAASIISLHLNKNLCALDAFLTNEPMQKFSRRYIPTSKRFPNEFSQILLVDDSISSGNSFFCALEAIKKSGYGGIVKTCAVYSSNKSKELVDIYFDIVDYPRYFEWNLFHREELIDFCVDLDGILCHDPNQDENDDSHRYLEFLNNAKPLNVPTTKIGAIVTNRLEKYRNHTEAWLLDNKIYFNELVMLNLSSAAERRAQNSYISHKADFYKNNNYKLFIESDSGQAFGIANYSGKPVLDYFNNLIIS